jgi:group I intron endonuclease
MRISGIYRIQSKIKSERIYIGSAVDINDRWRCHLKDLRNNKHHSKKLQRHYDKYGEVDLQLSILLGCEKEDLLKTEQYFIDSYNP